MEALYMYPIYFNQIIERLLNRNWLVHNFDNVEDFEIYNFSNYLYNKQMEGVTYNIYLDLNIYQFIINAFKKNQPKDEYRDAIALVVFCHFAEIELDPTYAVYEKINHRNEDHVLDEIISDLQIFHRINNTGNISLVSFALGTDDTIIPNENYELDPIVTKENLTKYRKLTEWDSIYLVVIFVIHTSLNSNLSSLEKLKKVVEWMITEFRLSLAGITFAAIYFSEKPMKKMMKYKQSDDPDARQLSAFNMTWDLYNLNRYVKMWAENESKQEGMFASADKVFNTVLREAIKVQQTGCLNCFSDFLPLDIVEYLTQITSHPDAHFERAYGSKLWSSVYKAELIKKYESLTGITHSRV